MVKGRVLLVGCGQLGTRHLQAIASVENVAEVLVLDHSADALELGKKRVAEVVDRNQKIKYHWHRELTAEMASGALCVVATQAKGRAQLVKNLVRELDYKLFFIEKIVEQSVQNYESLLSFCEEQKVKVYVNCKTRVYGVHKYIKAKLDPRQPLLMHDFGGNHGLANNGVHAADLFVYYEGCDQIIPTGARVSRELLPSKRGADLYDLGGSLYGASARGSDFMLSFVKGHVSPDHISIISPSGRFIVDHFQKWAFESYPAENWLWKKIPIDENWNVSHMSKKFVSDLLVTGRCELPTLRDTFPAHKFILEALQPNFNELLGEKSDSCPVT